VKANLLVAMGRFEEAGQAAREAERILALSLPADHWQLAMAKHLQGASLLGLREYAAAEPLLVQSMDGLAKSPLWGAARQGRANMAELYAALGRPDEARRYRDN
jgi:tetratricopeptide (TPR) repeat protein